MYCTSQTFRRPVPLTVSSLVVVALDSKNPDSSLSFISISVSFRAALIYVVSAAPWPGGVSTTSSRSIIAHDRTSFHKRSQGHTPDL